MHRLCSQLSLLLLLVITVPAFADDPNKALEAARKSLAKGKAADALKALDKGYKADLPLEAAAVKAEALLALDRAADAFAVLVAHKDAPTAKPLLAKAGAALPAQALRIVSTPSGAKVSIDGAERGNTPVSVQVTPGFHQVTVTQEGHSTSNEAVFVEAGKPADFSASLYSTTGALEVEVDSDGLTAVVGSERTPLVRGTNALAKRGPGVATVSIVDAAGVEVHRQDVNIASGGTSRVVWSKFATVKTPWGDGTVELILPEPKEGEKAPEPAVAAPELRLEKGKHKVLLRRPGHVPFQGELEVAPGKTMVLANETAKLPDRKALEYSMIAGLGVGAACIVVAIGLEFAKGDAKDAADNAKFALAAIGGALFVASGVTLKWVRDQQSNPTPEEGTFNVQLGVAPQKGGALLGASGRF